MQRCKQQQKTNNNTEQQKIYEVKNVFFLYKIRGIQSIMCFQPLRDSRGEERTKKSPPGWEVSARKLISFL